MRQVVGIEAFVASRKPGGGASPGVFRSRDAPVAGSGRERDEIKQQKSEQL